MKISIKKLCTLLLAVILILSLSACSSKESGNAVYKDEEINYTDDSESVISLKKISSGDVSASSLAESALEGKKVKLVYKATLTLQTQDFDSSCDTLTELVKKYEGYYESSSVSNGSYSMYADSYNKYGNFVIRIPTVSYNDFIQEIGDSIYVSKQSESVENIGQSYYETETHIATLKVEISRLQELMGRAENMSDIITIEKALAEAESELESYQTTLAGYDSLVEYSTITIGMEQVTFYSGSETSFWDEICSSFAYGWSSFIGGCGDFLLWIIENLFGIIVIVVLIILCRKFKWLKKLGNKIFKKSENQENK